jgi:hypothetical protein
MEKQVGCDGMTTAVRPMNNDNTHDIVLAIASRANAPWCSEMP